MTVTLMTAGGLGRVADELNAQRRLLVFAHLGELDVDPGEPDLGCCLLDRSLNYWTTRMVGGGHGDENLGSVTSDGESAEHSEFDDRPIELRIVNASERLAERCFSGGHSSS
jgi:hypothetical protein